MTILRAAAPLREQTVEAIRQRIIEGSFRPGMRLKEKDLVERYGVSRTVIREALRQMESERLVRIEPNVGPVVETLTADIARELYEVREALEGAAMQLAAMHRNPADIEHLRSMMTELEMTVGKNTDDMVAAKDSFYRLIILISRNNTIGEMLANVQSRISQLRRLTLSHPGREQQMLEEIRAMVEAVVAGNERQALEAARRHVRIARDIALEHLAQESTETPTGDPLTNPVRTHAIENR